MIEYNFKKCRIEIDIVPMILLIPAIGITKGGFLFTFICFYLLIEW